MTSTRFVAKVALQRGLGAKGVGRVNSVALLPFVGQHVEVTVRPVKIVIDRGE